MNEEEFKDFVDTLKEQGLKEEDILDIFYKAFEEGELSREDLDNAAKAMGYKAKKEFMEDSEGGDVKGVSEDQIEAAKEIDEGESEEDFKERVAEGEEVDEEDERAEDGEDEESDEEDERKEAMKLFD